MEHQYRRGIYRPNAQRLSISLAPLVAQRSLLFRVKADLATKTHYGEVSTSILSHFVCGMGWSPDCGHGMQLLTCLFIIRFFIIVDAHGGIGFGGDLSIGGPLICAVRRHCVGVGADHQCCSVCSVDVQRIQPGLLAGWFLAFRPRPGCCPCARPRWPTP